MQYPRLLVACMAACAGLASAAQPVKAPPLPPGSSMVRLEPGMSEPERKRQIRAHHHKGHHKKDHTHDDSLDTNEPGDTTSPAGNGKGNGKGKNKGSRP